MNETKPNPADPGTSTSDERTPSPEFVRQVAKARHDLRNPIGHIMGFAELLQEHTRQVRYEHLRPGLEAIGQEANEMVAAVNATLDAAKLQSSTGRLKEFQVQLHKSASQVIASTQTLAAKAGALKEDVFTEDLTRIAGAARRIRELVHAALAFLTGTGTGEAARADEMASLETDFLPSMSMPVAEPAQTRNEGAILVVDDQEENLEILRRRLSRLGYSVQLARNGRQALEFLAAHPVDLILLDVIMPELDGFQTLGRIKENAATRNVPVIMLSSADEAATVVHCLKLGADDFLPKPFNTTLLTARIEASLAKKRLREMEQAAATYYFDKGTLRHDSPSYVERQADKKLWEGLRKEEFCYVLTSRQMGKSSLMVRTAHRLREEGTNVVALDLTAIGQNLTPEQWYDGLVIRMGRQVRLEDELEEFWLQNKRLGPVQRFFTALREVVLKRRGRPLVIFVDELDTVRSLPFSSDEFFAAIRECYNRRTEDPEFNRLTFCLLGVATPVDLIREIRNTPFNIGRRIELADFTAVEAAPLASGLGREETAAHALLERVLHWTGGHPYLTQRFCRGIAQDLNVTKPEEVDRLCEKLFLSNRARDEDDNLLFVRKLMLQSVEDRASLLGLYDKIRRRKDQVRDDETNRLINILRLAGIVRREDGYLSVRNRIYARVFDHLWVKANLPAETA